MMSTLEQLKLKYPGTNTWQMGDSPALANELANLVIRGLKTASCGSFSSFQQETSAPRVGKAVNAFIAAAHRPAPSYSSLIPD